MAKSQLTTSQLKEVPGGFMLRIGRNPFALFRNAQKKYGDICYITGGRIPIYLINKPEYIHDILVMGHKDFAKRSPLKFLGNGLVTSNGEFHHRQKRLIQPAFHQAKIVGYSKTMMHYTEQISGEWKNGQVIDMHEQMMRLTLEIVSKCLFGDDLDHAWKEIRVQASLIGDYFDKLTGPMGPLMDHLPLPTNKKYHEAVRELDKIVYGIIAERRKSSQVDRDDLISMLFSGRDEKGEMMTDLQIRDETMTLLIAGHETTSNALTWTWYLLAKHPEVREKLNAELDRVLPNGRIPTAEDYPNLAYTTKIFTEVLRLYPSVRLVPRVAVNDHIVDGYRIPAGSLVLMSQHVVHHDPRLYKNPEEFNPDRWSPEMEQDLHEYAYFPFGGGPRRCAGEPFAWMEGVLITARIGQKWDMSLIPGKSYELKERLLSRPKHGMPMKLTAR